ncbi:uncharacterized protein LOC133189496 [Saccostrea echinata]|uniref:uncharacterized protein LOC133189496 n=1 Tax=Saccostrea echinata TaxID=191078 RepID=UPI002A80CF20|nr:uncharacterized protein LOC133189496 [Saccostrea echinata]
MRVIELLDQKLSQTKIAKQLGCSQALISRIANSKDEVRAQFLTSENLNRRRNRKGRAPDVDNALWAWYQSLLDQEPGKQISNKMLKDQARKLADEFGISPFSASKGWLNRWKNRYNLVIQPFKKTNAKSHEKNNSTLENLNAETENSITGAVSGLQSVEEEDQDDVSSKLCGENNNTNKQHLSQNVEHSVELLATQPEKDTSGSSTMNIPDSEMNEQVETHPVLGTSEKDTSATSTSNIPGTNSHERDVRATTLDKQLETQKLLATAFLHSLNILGPQTSAQGSSSFSPQLSGSAQEMVQNILELCRAPEQNPPIPTKNQLEEPKPAESFLALSGVNTSMLSPKQSTIVSSVQNCGANETETCDTGLRTPSQTHMLSDSTSLDAITSSIAHEPCSAITFMPAAVSEISSSFTNTYCIDGTIGTVSSTSSNAPKKQTSTTYGFSTTSKSKSKLKGKSLSNVLEEPVTPRYSTRKRTMNVIVQKLAEEESESDLNDDSDNDPNWEETERKKKSSSGHRNPKKDTDFSSDSDDLMDSEKDEDAFDEDDDYEDEDSAPSMEKPHSDDFKRKIILYAERHGNTKTAIRFHIKEEMVWNWREEKDTLFSVKGSSSNDVLTSRSQGITEEEYVTAAVVEYNKQRIYLGVIEKDKLTYCKTFLGKLDEQFSMSNINANSLILNKKDIQKFGKNEKQFLILSFSCPIKDLKLNINQEKCQYITEEVLRYYQQKKKI